MDEPTNPYAAPPILSRDEDEMLLRQPVIPVGRGLRFANLVIDNFAQMAVGAGVGFTVVLVGGNAGADLVDRTPPIALNILIGFGYYLLCETTTSRTLGKLVTGTKVVREDGGEPTFNQILGRSLARLIPFEAFSFLGASGRGLHDTLPNTFVVKCR